MSPLHTLKLLLKNGWFQAFEVFMKYTFVTWYLIEPKQKNQHLIVIAPCVSLFLK